MPLYKYLNPNLNLGVFSENPLGTGIKDDDNNNKEDNKENNKDNKNNKNNKDNRLYLNIYIK